MGYCTHVVPPRRAPVCDPLFLLICSAAVFAMSAQCLVQWRPLLMCSALRHPLGVVWVLRQTGLVMLRRCWLVGQRCCRQSYPLRPAALAEIVSVPNL